MKHCTLWECWWNRNRTATDSIRGMRVMCFFVSEQVKLQSALNAEAFLQLPKLTLALTSVLRPHVFMFSRAVTHRISDSSSTLNLFRKSRSEGLTCVSVHVHSPYSSVRQSHTHLSASLISICSVVNHCFQRFKGKGRITCVQPQRDNTAGSLSKPQTPPTH